MANKLLVVIHQLTYGGAGKMITFLVNKLSREGYDIHLLTYEKNEIWSPLGQTVHHVDFHYPSISVFGFRRILQILQIRHVIGKIKPDAVLSFLPYPNVISVLAAAGMGMPVIISERSDPYAHPSWFTRLRNIVYSFADGYVFQTNGAKNYFNRRIQAKGVVIPNPIAAEAIPDRWLGERDNVIVSVGRFDLEDKRQDVLIEAFSKIADRFPDAKLILYGDGKDELKIRRMIARCNLEKRVVLAGVTRNVYEAIIKAKLFVLSSDHEGFPNALIEAMSVGLPCIATDCSPGGAAELIRNMENGILVEPGCVDELANAIGFILDNPNVATALGQNARNIVTDLDSDVIIRRWTKYIDRYISMDKK